MLSFIAIEIVFLILLSLFSNIRSLIFGYLPIIRSINSLKLFFSNKNNSLLLPEISLKSAKYNTSTIIIHFFLYNFNKMVLLIVLFV